MGFLRQEFRAASVETDSGGRPHMAVAEAIFLPTGMGKAWSSGNKQRRKRVQI